MCRGRAEDEIHIRIFIFQFVFAAFLCRHTTANGDDQLGILMLDMLILANDRECLQLRMLADGAGIDHNEICLLGLLSQLIAHRQGAPLDFFAVRLVLLTAKGQDKGTAALACFGRILIIPQPKLFDILLLIGVLFHSIHYDILLRISRL